ncbi:MAG: hypothetical protein U0031_13860 [Thermomicrobiales bacterium]
MNRKMELALSLALFVQLSGSSAGAQPDIPTPDECRVVPRPQSDLLAQMSSLPSTSETSNAPELVYGQTVSEEIQEGISATFRELIACNNAGDLQRMFSLYSNRLLARLDAEDAGLESKPHPLPIAERTIYIGVLSFYPLSDGRIGAIVCYHDPRVAAPAEAFFWIFVESDDRWLWDEFPDPYYTEVIVNGEQQPIDDQ